MDLKLIGILFAAFSYGQIAQQIVGIQAAATGGATSPSRFNGCTALGFSSPVTCNISSVTTGMAIVVAAGTDATTNAFTFTDNCNTAGASDTYTSDTQTTAGTSGVAQSATAKVGANTATCTISVASTSSGSVDIEVEAINSPASTPIDVQSGWFYQNNPTAAANNITSGTTTGTSGSITTTHNGDYCWASTIDVGVDGHTLSAGTTLAWTLREHDTTYSMASEDFTQTTSGTINATFTQATANGQYLTKLICFSSH
jgi:hypothetical protein